VDHFLRSHNISYTVLVEDVQKHFEEARVSSGDGNWDTEYHPYDPQGGIASWLQAAAAANPSFVSLFTLGQSYEKRPIYGLKIGKDTTNKNPVIYLDGGIHAREWMAPATIEYIIGQFVNHSTDAKVNQYITEITWYLVPVWNVDGYNYTWTTDAEWRKNRQPNTGSTCVGTDLNRNCATGWSLVGASADPCSDEYHGTAAWSGEEAALWRDFLTTLVASRPVIGYVNFHANAEMWLDPWGYTAAHPADYTTQQNNGKAVTDAIKAVNGAAYAYGPIYTTIYPASGGTCDWTYDAPSAGSKGLGIVLSQACEVRGNSFQPSPTLILPIGEEILQGVYKLADDALALYAEGKHMRA